MAERMIIFLCDDDEDEVFFLGSALPALGEKFELKSFLTCADLVHALEHGLVIPDLIILELSMPDEGGLSCLKKIRASSLQTPAMSSLLAPKQVKELIRQLENADFEPKKNHRH
jgi:DNA-binding response OmpR family regulator